MGPEDSPSDDAPRRPGGWARRAAHVGTGCLVVEESPLSGQCQLANGSAKSARIRRVDDDRTEQIAAGANALVDVGERCSHAVVPKMFAATGVGGVVVVTGS